MEKVAVVLRQLPGHDAVVSGVVRLPADHVEHIDNEESYFDSELKDIKDDFCKKFVEFNKAVWTYQVIEMFDRSGSLLR